jgi:peroxiredoxin
MKKLLVLTALLLPLFFVSCSSSSEETTKGEEKGYPQMPPFTLVDIDGNIVSLEDYRGKVVLVNFWATWCGPCIKEIPELNELYHEFKDRDFELLAIAAQSGDAETIREWVQRLRIEYPVLVGDSKVTQKYRVFAFPTDYLADKNGNTRDKIIGAPPGKKERLAKAIEELLEE